MTICDGPFVQTHPVVEFNGTNYIVVWSDSRFTGNRYWIVASCVDTSGLVLDNGYCIGAAGQANEYRPDIAYDGDRCFAVWYSSEEPFGINGRLINESGQPEGEVIKVAPTLASHNMNPSVEFAGVNYLVVWADIRPGFSDLDISGQFVSPQGQLVGSPLLVASGSSNQMYPEVAYDGNVALVIWREGETAVFGQRIFPDGSLCGSNFQISDNLPYYRFNAGIDMSSSNCLVTWSESRTGETDIYGNVDVMTSIDEDPVPMSRWEGATLFSGRFALPGETQCKVYDVCGRDVTGDAFQPGVYFVEVGDGIVQKVILIR
ncbi:MAG: hypothetical protein JSU64_09145 [candidate division WOR-3 bacterium]|nr:MAG: hypothetical protein JSU64_09145 [candidate division WOR-3 bacterium]